MPRRILDTRDFLAVNARSSIDVQVPDANGASAAVLSVATIVFDAGYWTFFPTGTEPPLAANLNSLYPFHIAANQVIVPLDASGRFSVYSQSGGHVIVDLVGLVTGASAPVSTEGLFVPLSTPTRFTDTRDPALNPLGGTQMALPTWNLEVAIVGNPAIGRTDVAAVSMNLTVTEALAAGYVTAGRQARADPNNKARSTATREHRPAGADAAEPRDRRGVRLAAFDLFTQSGAHLIADVAGYYLGSTGAVTVRRPEEHESDTGRLHRLPDHARRTDRHRFEQGARSLGPSSVSSTSGSGTRAPTATSARPPRRRSWRSRSGPACPAEQRARRGDGRRAERHALPSDPGHHLR